MGGQSCADCLDGSNWIEVDLQDTRDLGEILNSNGLPRGLKWSSFGYDEEEDPIAMVRTTGIRDEMSESLCLS